MRLIPVVVMATLVVVMLSGCASTPKQAAIKGLEQTLRQQQELNQRALHSNDGLDSQAKSVGVQAFVWCLFFVSCDDE